MQLLELALFYDVNVSHNLFNHICSRINLDVTFA